MTDIDLLRKAAALMRERANDAEGVMGPGPWTGGHLGHDGTDMTYNVEIDCIVLAATLAEEVSLHIASWHPAVALAVAGWLDWTADHGLERNRAAALDVARAYLGEPAPASPDLGTGDGEGT